MRFPEFEPEERREGLEFLLGIVIWAFAVYGFAHAVWVVLEKVGLVG